MPSAFFNRLTEHDVASVFATVAATVFDPRDACALRSTCRLAVRGYDCAVHAGWVPIAGHRSGEPAEEGATCEWVWGWFPMRLRVSAPPAGKLPNACVSLRLEHRLIRNLVREDDVPFVPCDAAVMVCETLQRLHADTTPPVFESPVLSYRGIRALRVNAPPSDSLIGASCMMNLPALTLMDTCGLESVEFVGDEWLAGCDHLRAVDTRGLTGVCGIGGSFMLHLQRLTAFDTAGLTRVVSIGDFFLYACPMLRSFDAGGLTSVTSVGTFFLYESTSLEAFNSRGLEKLTSVGANFMSCSTSLKAFDASGLTSVTEVGASFLFGCTELPAVVVPRQMLPALVSPDTPARFMQLCAPSLHGGSPSYRRRKTKRGFTLAAARPSEDSSSDETAGS